MQMYKNGKVLTDVGGAQLRNKPDLSHDPKGLARVWRRATIEAKLKPKQLSDFG
jgi:hypothetical protein